MSSDIYLKISIEKKYNIDYEYKYVICSIKKETDIKYMCNVTTLWNGSLLHKNVLENVLNHNFKTISEIKNLKINQSIQFYGIIESRTVNRASHVYNIKIIPRHNFNLLKVCSNDINIHITKNYNIFKTIEIEYDYFFVLCYIHNDNININSSLLNSDAGIRYSLLKDTGNYVDTIKRLNPNNINTYNCWIGNIIGVKKDDKNYIYTIRILPISCEKIIPTVRAPSSVQSTVTSVKTTTPAITPSTTTSHTTPTTTTTASLATTTSPYDLS
jgi:hypothetical protein